MMDPKDALLALTAKWMLKALALGNSNAQYLLQYKLLQTRLAKTGT
jgi:TPR repeat protein